MWFCAAGVSTSQVDSTDSSSYALRVNIIVLSNLGFSFGSVANDMEKYTSYAFSLGLNARFLGEAGSWLPQFSARANLQLASRSDREEKFQSTTKPTENLLFGELMLIKNLGWTANPSLAVSYSSPIIAVYDYSGTKLIGGFADPATTTGSIGAVTQIISGQTFASIRLSGGINMFSAINATSVTDVPSTPFVETSKLAGSANLVADVQVPIDSIVTVVARTDNAVYLGSESKIVSKLEAEFRVTFLSVLGMISRVVFTYDERLSRNVSNQVSLQVSLLLNTK
jgi:hypothetical protein